MLTPVFSSSGFNNPTSFNRSLSIGLIQKR
jgi:hypothetical protein